MTDSLPTASPPEARGHTVLVVDDDVFMRDLIAQMLMASGFSVVTAANGREALLRLDEQTVSLVLTDIHMPVMDGMELIRKLRFQRPGLPVIAISGADDWQSYRRLAVDLGARAALQKPVDRDELVGAVRQSLTGAP
jgi:CheY-like chemotaxis protein